MNLPLNCEVQYYENFLKLSEAKDLFAELIPLIGKLNFTPRTENGNQYMVDFDKIMFVDQDLYDENKFPKEIWGQQWFGQIK